jgi:hypothetical protein
MFSKVVRRTHMYLALFLSPWILMYALSTMAMNHRKQLLEWFGGAQPKFEKQSEVQLPHGVHQPHAPREENARRILQALNLDGTHSIQKPGADGTLVLVRQEAAAPVRVTYQPAANKALIERQPFHATTWLERMHRRRGYQHPYAMEKAWAFSVDLVIVVIVFWVLSGLWMWWELKSTRWLGALSAVAGLGLFAFFLASI